MAVDLAQYPFDARVIHEGSTDLERVVALKPHSQSFDIHRYIENDIQAFHDLVYAHLAVVFEVDKPVALPRLSRTFYWDEVMEKSWGGGVPLHLDDTCEPSLLTPRIAPTDRQKDTPWRINRPPTLVARALDVKDSVRNVIAEDPSLFTDNIHRKNITIREILEEGNHPYATPRWPENYGGTLGDNFVEAAAIADLIKRRRVYRHQWAEQQGYTILAIPNKTMGMAEGPEGHFSIKVLPCNTVHGRPNCIGNQSTSDPHSLNRAFIRRYDDTR